MSRDSRVVNEQNFDTLVRLLQNKLRKEEIFQNTLYEYSQPFKNQNNQEKI